MSKGRNQSKIANTVPNGLPWSHSRSWTLNSILVTDLTQDEDRTACPYHLRRLERRAAVTSCIPSRAGNKSMKISSWGLTPQIHRTIDLSFRRSHCKSGAVRAHVSLPWRRAERTQESNTFPRTVRDLCLDVRIGRSVKCVKTADPRHNYLILHKSGFCRWRHICI